MMIGIAILAAALASAAGAQEAPGEQALLQDVQAPVLRQVDPNPTPLICPFRGAIECGRITAPENRERPDAGDHDGRDGDRRRGAHAPVLPGRGWIDPPLDWTTLHDLV